MAVMLAQLRTRLKKVPFYRQAEKLAKPVSRIFESMGDDNIALIAGGVAFYAFLSIFPGIACALMVWGLFNDADQLSQYLTVAGNLLPAQAFDLIADQMVQIAEARSFSLSWGAVISLLIALWSASRAVNALLSAMFATSSTDKRRNFLHQNLVAVSFTMVGILFALISLIIIGAVQPIIDALFLRAYVEAIVHAIRWLLMFSLFFIGVYGFYRVSHPKNKKGQRIKPEKLWPGALLAALMWLAASIAFSFYLRHFDALNETFGSLGAVVALLMWLWISAFAICMGAETNAELYDMEGDGLLE